MGANQYYVAPRGLHRNIKPQPGGLWHIYYAPIEDLASFPSVTPSTAIVDNPLGIELTGGKSWYVANAAVRRGYHEEQKNGDAGPYMEITVTAFIPFDTKLNHLTLDRLKYHKFILIVERPDGLKRVVGAPDNPALFSHSHDTGEKGADTAGTLITFTCISEDKPPVYEGDVTPIVIT